MNRRDFFKLTAGVAALTALPLDIWTPTKTIFLPPRSGWIGSPIQMRELEQYYIESDRIGRRYDAAWETPTGRVQHHVDFTVDWMQDPVKTLEQNREIARAYFEKVERENYFRIGQRFALNLPRGVSVGRYV